jgi:hypothetical protein
MVTVSASAIGQSREDEMLQARQAKRISRIDKSVGVLVVGVWLLAGCQAGELPCTKDEEWKAICAGSKASGGSGGGGTATGGSGGGGAQGDAGGTGGMPAATVNKDTPIANCSKYPTLGKMDDFFAMRCGVAVNCHNAMAPWTNMALTDSWMVLKDAVPKIDCKSDKIVDSTTWSKSLVWVKTRKPGPPACPTTGGIPGTIMPPPEMMPKMDLLTADEDACLQGFLKAIAGAQ